MSKHEIRLRRQKLTARGTDRFRNYGVVLERHEKEVRLKKLLRVFAMFFVILIFIMLIVIVIRLEKRATKQKPSASIHTWVLKSSQSYNQANHGSDKKLNFSADLIPYFK